MGAILVLGATSTIARETVHQFAAERKKLVLAGRNMEELERIKQDLEVRYQIQVSVKAFDALAFEQHQGFFDEVVVESGELEGVILMYGAMEDQKESEQDFDLSRKMIDVNYTSAVSILNIAANYFEKQRRGFICAVSSVAGDRGRKSNYIYGSTKAGLTVYMQGLRNRLHEAGVNVLTVKPGMVDTKMTYGVVDDSFLLASPKKVAKDINSGLKKKRDVLYTPWFWIIIMLIIKLIPEKIFKRTDI
ncbi:SDR family oxidoreductase [Ornithinibacillus californiensis]|uniref:SDR family oxidoreductase n=1 Tax=Ornithinibacillus californiensis TaxID=161536 RepID=UPI00064DAFE7|nr:SDR family oxidoreductase [Ornithinibacillus californiensis]